MATTVHSERVWKVEFLKYFQKFLGDTWFLCKCNEKDPVPERWRRFRDSAKVRFCCETCSNGWTSMKGRIVFWFYLDYRTRVGYCLFKLYGQKCKKCNKNLTFEAPMWYPEEINKVICNVYNRIGEVYYNFSKATLLVDRRDGRPRLQHNRDLCQACLTGECWNGPGDIINAEGYHISQKNSDESGIASPSGSFKTSASEETDGETQPTTQVDDKKQEQQSPTSVAADDQTSKTNSSTENGSSTDDEKSGTERKKSDDSGIETDLKPGNGSGGNKSDKSSSTVSSAFHKEFIPPMLPPQNFMVPPMFAGFPAGFPCPPPPPPANFSMFPQSPANCGMISQSAGPGMLKAGTPNSPLYLPSPIQGGNKGVTGPPGMEMASPSWAHYNLLNALNRLYIS